MQLSICIPTYNRSEALSSLLQVLCTDLEFHGIEAEVVVSDNASPDDTQEVVAKFHSRFANIKYYRNTQNLGGTANFHLAIERGTSEHCWLIGDDSIVCPGAVKHIVEILHKHRDLALLFLGGDNLPLSKPEYLRTQFAKHGKYFEVDDRSQFLASITIQEIGCISCLVVHRNSWLKTNYVAMPHAFIYPHINSVLELLTSNRPIIYTHRLCFVSTRANDDHNAWYLDRAPLSVALEWPWMQRRAVALGFANSDRGFFCRYNGWKIHQCLILIGYDPFFEATYNYIVKREFGLVMKLFLKSLFLCAGLVRPIVRRLAKGRIAKVKFDLSQRFQYQEPDLLAKVDFNTVEAAAFSSPQLA